MSIQEAESHHQQNTQPRPEERPDLDRSGDRTGKLGETALGLDGTVINLFEYQKTRIKVEIDEHRAEIARIAEDKSDGVAVITEMTADEHAEAIESLEAQLQGLEDQMNNNEALDRAAVIDDARQYGEFKEFERRMPEHMLPTHYGSEI